MTITRKTPMARTSSLKRAEPSKEPKRRVRKCVTCREQFEPRSMAHKACKPECAAAHVAKEKARKDRKERQEGLAKLKTRSDWIKEVQRNFNAFIRERDKNQPCICCGRTKTKVDGLGAHGWDCGHYRSTGSAPHLRFHEDNAHRQLVYCNRDRAGNAVEYRAGLIARIGLARVEALETDDRLRHWTIPDLVAMRDHYRAKLRELKKEQA